MPTKKLHPTNGLAAIPRGLTIGAVSLMALIVALGTLLASATTVHAASPAGQVGMTTQHTDGDIVGDWKVVFAGYGAVQSYAKNSKRLALTPRAVSDASATSASLAVSTESFADKRVRINTRLVTTEQLRLNDAPNPWEVPWLVWDYQDNEHFYYAVAKPNGWELGKRDPAYPGGQRFLATGSDIAVQIGDAATLNVVRVDLGDKTRIKLKIDGALVANFIDDERPYSEGSVGAYTEDAAVEFKRTAVNGSVLLTS